VRQQLSDHPSLSSSRGKINLPINHPPSRDYSLFPLQHTVAAYQIVPLAPATIREFWYSYPHPLNPLVVTPGLDPVATTKWVSSGWDLSNQEILFKLFGVDPERDNSHEYDGHNTTAVSQVASRNSELTRTITDETCGDKRPIPRIIHPEVEWFGPRSSS
jgi:hypothetical protein